MKQFCETHTGHLPRLLFEKSCLEGHKNISTFLKDEESRHSYYSNKITNDFSGHFRIVRFFLNARMTILLLCKSNLWDSFSIFLNSNSMRHAAVHQLRCCVRQPHVSTWCESLLRFRPSLLLMCTEQAVLTSSTGLPGLHFSPALPVMFFI